MECYTDIWTYIQYICMCACVCVWCVLNKQRKKVKHSVCHGLFLNFPIICEWKLKTWRVLAAWHAYPPHTYTHMHMWPSECVCVFVCLSVPVCVSISIGHELNWPVQQQNCFSNGNTTWNSHNKLLNNSTVLTMDNVHPSLISPSVCQRVYVCVHEK